MIFKKLISNSAYFFDMLPDDWQQEIVPYWKDYKNTSEIYIIEKDQKIIGGGIVFSTCPPDLHFYEKKAQKWFNNDYLYLGFIWIAENERNKNLGSFWLAELKKANPTQNYWLVIEEEHLHRFYQKNGFVLEMMISHDTSSEWLYKYDSLSK